MPQMREVTSTASAARRPAEHRLEEARWLEDLEAHVLNRALADADVQRPLALDPGELADVDPPNPFAAAHRLLPSRPAIASASASNAGAAALMNR